MNPNPETLKAAAETDQGIQNLLERLEATLETIPIERQKLLNQGKLDEAKKLEQVKIQVDETLGLLRAHPITSAHGGSELAGRKPSFRGEDGKYAEYGSDRYFVGVHARINKSQRGRT